MGRPAVLEVDKGAWIADAIDYIVTRARRVGTVTADDLRRDLPEPHHPNAFGTVFLIASSRKLIEQVDGGPSKIRSRHGGHRGVWRLHPDQLKGQAA
ncbi:MAG: hypothetical protein QJR09_08000 [Micrococcus sp.]|nr:hypothetical protein [Micrococcus sp.]